MRIKLRYQKYYSHLATITTRTHGSTILANSRYMTVDATPIASTSPTYHEIPITLTNHAPTTDNYSHAARANSRGFCSAIFGGV